MDGIEIISIEKNSDDRGWLASVPQSVTPQMDANRDQSGEVHVVGAGLALCAAIITIPASGNG